MRHDYWCPTCKMRLLDQFRTAAQGGRNTAPECPHCVLPMIWVVPRLRMDLRSDGEGKSGETFQKFHARDGHNNLVEIDSLHTLRKIERESEQAARNGEGQIVRFRAFEQDHSNLGVNVFGDTPHAKISDETKRKFGLRNGAKVIEGGEDGAAPDYSFGPGVSESNASALPSE